MDGKTKGIQHSDSFTTTTTKKTDNLCICN